MEVREREKEEMRREAIEMWGRRISSMVDGGCRAGLEVDDGLARGAMWWRDCVGTVVKKSWDMDGNDGF